MMKEYEDNLSETQPRERLGLGLSLRVSLVTITTNTKLDSFLLPFRIKSISSTAPSSPGMINLLKVPLVFLQLSINCLK